MYVVKLNLRKLFEIRKYYIIFSMNIEYMKLIVIKFLNSYKFYEVKSGIIIEYFKHKCFKAFPMTIVGVKVEIKSHL